MLKSIGLAATCPPVSKFLVNVRVVADFPIWALILQSNATLKYIGSGLARWKFAGVIMRTAHSSVPRATVCG